jgi:hypothetical protein
MVWAYVLGGITAVGLLISLLIPASSCYPFGKMVDGVRQGLVAYPVFNIGKRR